MPRLSEIQIVDLKKSKWDSKKSDPKKGKFVFTEKVYLDTKSKAEYNVFFSWCSYDPQDGYAMFRDWQTRLGYQPVRSEDELYYPEGCLLNSEHYYQYGDVVLMVVPATLEMARRQRDIALAGRSREMLKKFQASVDAEEPGAGISQEEMRRLAPNR